MEERKVEKIICISKCLRRLQSVQEAKKESVVLRLLLKGFG